MVYSIEVFKGHKVWQFTPLWQQYDFSKDKRLRHSELRSTLIPPVPSQRCTKKVASAWQTDTNRLTTPVCIMLLLAMLTNKASTFQTDEAASIRNCIQHYLHPPTFCQYGSSMSIWVWGNWWAAHVISRCFTHYWLSFSNSTLRKQRSQLINCSILLQSTSVHLSSTMQGLKNSFITTSSPHCCNNLFQL